MNRRNLLTFAGISGLLPSAGQGRAYEINDHRDILEPVHLTEFLTPEMLTDVQSGRLQVDCAPALQAALDFASGKNRTSSQTGCKLIIPAGKYLLASPVRLSWRNEQGIISDGDMRRITIEGDGQANTIFVYQGDPNSPAFTIQGYKNGREEGGVWQRITMSGFIISRIIKNHLGIGLYFSKSAFIRLIDMQISGFDINIDLTDTLRVYIESVQILNGNVGIRANFREFSFPNVFKIVNCSISYNNIKGLHITGGSNISIDSCALEENGTYNGNGTDDKNCSSIFFEGGPAQGGSAGHIENCYFEGNKNIYDVLIDFSGNNGGTIKFTSCTFHRIGNSNLPTHHLLLRSLNASLIAHIDSCGFKSFENYIPSKERPVIVTEGRGVKTVYTANLFQNTIESPEI
jgi:hypothetical protein